MRFTIIPGIFKLMCLGLFVIVVLGAGASASVAAQTQDASQAGETAAAGVQSTGMTIFVPQVYTYYSKYNIFGFETDRSLAEGSVILSKAKELNGSYVRMNNRISWRLLQPTRDSEIQWSQLVGFENELRALRDAGMRPIVIVDDHPLWATVRPISCAAIKPENYQDFASFVKKLVLRYKDQPFNVHIWELGNEPDVDPDLVPANSPFGCWGDENDDYYGGRSYGDMLKVVTPEIKAADSTAQVWIGGLLLDSPNGGRASKFFEGILVSEAAPYFDVVPYHWYPTYYGEPQDYDAFHNAWEAMGGGVIGKARFLREVMDRYSVKKPLVINETAFGSLNPDALFFELQADFVLQAFTRGLSEGIEGFIWYTLEGPGWRDAGLLDSSNTPRPVFTAYQQFIKQISNAEYLGPVDYGAEVEGYRFRKNNKVVEVIWSRSSAGNTIEVPFAQFSALYNRNGVPQTLVPLNTMVQVPVGSSPVYLVKSY